ncbi:tRNA pseudouridine(38/39) synthase [Hypsizygus marmoreus]|uniref:tRNA pseudouridine(38/39) synthase n=1 Tax=Hypsizygus marmoreus TaxID=39966 RepID=A0A369K3Z4_HYPMA|nr:tRNA pseudouridine(38/39) synthase [Hypsizygus marmoreus]
MASPQPSSIYDGWSREELIARLTELDHKPKQRPPSPKPRHKAFHFATYSRRKIALKFCYSGWEYGGLAFQNTKTPLPTVEAVMFDAFVKARLIDPEAGFEGCGWEKCGRTDRGVSAAGQVISLWVRSALGTESGTDSPAEVVDKNKDVSSMPSAVDIPSSEEETPSSVTPQEDTNVIPRLEYGFDEDDLDAPQSSSNLTIPPLKTKPKFEHDYLSILNRLLPPTIRILAWSPVSDKFSARFSCTYRHYKYFFSPDTFSGPGLDVERMRAAASRLIGEHDFRNMCKIDAGKQITMFRRNVMRAEINVVSVDGDGKGMYVFNLIGSAFLYHQVRHIMAILFMVGSGLEDPSVVTTLMNVEPGLEKPDDDSQTPLEVVDRKPEYQMADALPLVLWDCGYPDTELDWRINSYDSEEDNENWKGTELYQQLHAIHSRSQIYTALNNHFLVAASPFHLPTPAPPSISSPVPNKLFIPLGGGAYRRTGEDKYVPLLKRNRLDHVDVVNERWRVGKGFRRNERRRVAEESDDDDDGNE